MSKKFDEYRGKQITKEVLDMVKVGDYIRCNDWKRAIKVRGVSENYFVAAMPFGKWLYSVCEKKPFKGIKRNSLVGGYFSIGVDNRLFGFSHEHAYEFDNDDFVKDYLESFERGECKLSMRKSCALFSIAIRRGKWANLED